MNPNKNTQRLSFYESKDQLEKNPWSQIPKRKMYKNPWNQRISKYYLVFYGTCFRGAKLGDIEVSFLSQLVMHLFFVLFWPRWSFFGHIAMHLLSSFLLFYVSHWSGVHVLCALSLVPTPIQTMSKQSAIGTQHTPFVVSSVMGQPM